MDTFGASTSMQTYLQSFPVLANEGARLAVMNQRRMYDLLLPCPGVEAAVDQFVSMSPAPFY